MRIRRWDDKNHLRTSESAEVGTRITGGSGANSNVVIDAGHDLVARQVTVQTGGLLSAHAAHDIDLQAGLTTSESDSATQHTTRGLTSRTTTTTRETRETSTSQGSRFEGGTVSITAANNITGQGVKIKCDEGVRVRAGNVLDLHEARDVRSETSEVGVRRIGFGVGTTGVPVPDKRSATDLRSTFSDTAATTGKGICTADSSMRTGTGTAQGSRTGGQDRPASGHSSSQPMERGQPVDRQGHLHEQRLD